MGRWPESVISLWREDQRGNVEGQGTCNGGEREVVYVCVRACAIGESIVGATQELELCRHGDAQTVMF